MSRTDSRVSLCARLQAVLTDRADHIAVREQDRTVTFAEFGALIRHLQTAIESGSDGSGRPVGLLLDRSALAYAAMWASIGHGRAYVPLNTAYPGSRLRSILEQADVDTVVCDLDTHDLALELGIDTARLVIGSTDDVPASAPSTDAPWWRMRVDREIAYVLYTSGSTGRPKGVPISYDNLLAFIDNMSATIEYRSSDICSQSCELSFDFSTHEIYLAMLAGCTLCPARRVDLFNPAHYVASRSITVWIAVPSLARVVLNNPVPIGESLHGLRTVVFNGEALTTGVATALQCAAPNAALWNTYGPTECTVAVTAHRWSSDAESSADDVVTLGRAFPDCRTALSNGEHIVSTSAAADGHTGELLLGTPQRFSGYTDSSLASPFTLGEDGTVYYRTGDRVLWRAGRLHYLGRTDHQVKIGGHRIELFEIEQRFRSLLDTESLAVIARPERCPTELVLFAERTAEPPSLDREALALPRYMIPAKIILLERLPTTPHGKLDRAALQTVAEAAA